MLGSTIASEVLFTFEAMEPTFEGHFSWYDGDRLAEATFGIGMRAVANGIRIIFTSDLVEGTLQLRISLQTDRPILLKSLSITQVQPVEPADLIFINGYQSWTESRGFTPTESIPKMRAPLARLFNTTGDYTFYNNPGKAGQLHAWSFTSLTQGNNTRFWIDDAPETGYTIFEWRCEEGKLHIRKDVGGRKVEGEALLLSISHWQETGTEITRIPTAHPRPVKAPATGWTSWYNYYTKITEGIILDNLRAFGLREIPIDVFQIDDGWQPAVGDWTSANKKFPQGMAFLADQVHRYGYKAGLWLAPLIVEKSSAVYQLHRDWLVTHDGEHLLEAGYNPGWGGLFNGTYYLLDIELPEVRAHLKSVFDTVLLKWGYDLVKLDFLFAAALIPRNGKSRGQLMAEACDFLRECCGDKLILGCGVPMAPAWNVFDYCRIGPDIGLSWEMNSGKMIHMRERISTHNACHNTISRRHFSARFFANDPDVFILRDQHNELSPQQKNTLLLLNHIFGDLLFTSDDIGAYDDPTMRLYRSTFPARPRKITKVEQTGELYRIWFEISLVETNTTLHYFAAANLARLDHKMALPPGNWYRNGEGFVEDPNAVYFRPFETRVYLSQPTQLPGIVGSDLHIFPGCEVELLLQDEKGLTLKLSTQTMTSGNLVLAIPEPEASEIWINGSPFPTYRRNQLHLVLLSIKEGQLTLRR